MKTLASLDLAAMKALLVDDNAHMRVLLRAQLQMMGMHDIRECTDGAGALQEVSIFRPTFVITDLSMAPMDGIAFTRAMRASQDRVLQEMPIIMVTGHTERNLIEASRDAGINEILAKPITIGGLSHRIEQITLRRRAFVRSSSYIGPCRRRQRNPAYAGPKRRKEDLENTFEIDDVKKIKG